MIVSKDILPPVSDYPRQSSIKHYALSIEHYLLSFLLLTILWGCSSHKNSHTTAVKTPVPTHVNLSAASSKPAKVLLQEADKWLGTPYKYGGDRRGKGVDCSGLVNRIYADALSISLPRNSAAQAEFCKDIEKAALDIGDLVFFSPNGKGRINHVGMYIGDGCMIHASGSKGVMISRLNEPYFQRNYRRSGRVEPYEQLLASSSKSKNKKRKPRSQQDDELSSSGSGPIPNPSSVTPSSMPDFIESDKSDKSDNSDTSNHSSSATANPSSKSKTQTPTNLPSIKVKVKNRADSVASQTLPERPNLEDVLDQKVDSICSSFFD